jgi:hypothetical protein
MDNSAISAPVRDYHFKPGHSEYRARQDRIAERYRQLCLEYDVQTATQRSLAQIAAAALDDAERTRFADRRVRSLGAAKRALNGLTRKRAPAMTFDDYVRLKGTAK